MPINSRSRDIKISRRLRESVLWLYPEELESSVMTRPGEALRLRPIRPVDEEKLAAFHRRLSSESIYRRYFSVHPTLTPLELAHLTQVDYVNRLALVITNDECLLAIGRYERYPGTSEAEVAFIVADDHQHHGLGSILLQHLAAAAWDRGITTFLAETFATNREMVSVFLGAGYPVTTTTEQHEVAVRLSIGPLTTDARPGPSALSNA